MACLWLLAACTGPPPSVLPHAPDLDTKPPAPAGAPSWIHVAHPTGRRAYLADQSGREVFLAGVNITGSYINHEDQDTDPSAPPRPQDPALFDGVCPTNDNGWRDPPICQLDAGKGPWSSAAYDSHNDLSQVRALGLNLVRLTISWEAVEPTPGHYDQQFIERVRQIVDWAQEQGVYVLVDFHEDNYGDVPRADPPPGSQLVRPQGQADGAPRWAVMTDGLPNLILPGLPTGSAQAVGQAFQHFWQNDDPGVPQGEAPGRGLQDHYLGAVAAVMGRLTDRSDVVGVELMNEPQSGQTDLVTFPTQYLYPFYRRAIEALTGERDGLPTCPAATPTSGAGSCAYPALLHDDRHLVFFEPQAARNTLDFSIQSNQPFSAYPNLVFAPHVYTHIFTIDAVTHQNPTTATYPPDYDFAYRTADAEARSMGTALFVTEFGGGENVASTLTAGTMSAQERWLVGGTIWEWKGNCPASGACDPTDPGTWSVYQPGGAGPNPPQNGPIEPGRRRQLARISPRLVAGSTKSEKFDPDDGSFTLAATHDAPITIGDRDHETCIEAPPGVGGAVSVSGAAALDTAVSNPDGSRSIWVAPTGAGDYTVSVAATP